MLLAQMFPIPAFAEVNLFQHANDFFFGNLTLQQSYIQTHIVNHTNFARIKLGNILTTNLLMSI